MPDEPTGGSVVIPLVGGLVKVHLSMHDLDGSVRVGIGDDDNVAKDAVCVPDSDALAHLGPVKVGPATVELAFDVDNSMGEVTVKGTIHAPIVGDVHIDEVLAHYNPTHGSIGKREDPDPPIFDDEQFGKTRMSSKNVTRIFVEDRERKLANVGQVVKQTLWPDHEDWVFNTVACVGAFDDTGRGSYGDPSSLWFNVFLGYYQIDAPKPQWTRPFAYEAAKGSDSKVVYDEIVRLGKSDWNYFSNWMYGVPQRAAERHNDFDLTRMPKAQTDAGKIGETGWHHVAIGGADFVSAYEADHADAERLVDNSLISGLWRKAFGTPKPSPKFPKSFIGTTIDAEIYIAYWEDDEAFHTVMFGGTAPAGSDPEFLARQMKEAKRVIERGYPTIGFKPSA